MTNRCHSEEWKPIPGYEGIYDASNFGRIRSTPGKVTSSALYPERHWKTRVLKTKRQRPPGRGDERVTLWKEGTSKDHLVSRLVASAWIGVPAQKMTVNHINGDFTDNRPENLEWVTLQDNIRHGFETGLYASTQNPVALTDKNNNSFQFSSMSEASRFLGREDHYVSGAYRNGRVARSSSGETYSIQLSSYIKRSSER